MENMERAYDLYKSSFGMQEKLAHTYVPRQGYGRVFSPSEALCKGTIFPDLWGVYKIPR